MVLQVLSLPHWLSVLSSSAQMCRSRCQSIANAQCQAAESTARQQQESIHTLMTPSRIRDLDRYKVERPSSIEGKNLRRELYGVAKQVIDLTEARLNALKHPNCAIEETREKISASRDEAEKVLRSLQDRVCKCWSDLLEELPPSNEGRETDPSITQSFDGVREFMLLVKDEVSTETDNARIHYSQRLHEHRNREAQLVDFDTPWDDQEYAEVRRKIAAYETKLSEQTSKMDKTSMTIQNLHRVGRSDIQVSAMEPPQPCCIATDERTRTDEEYDVLPVPAKRRKYGSSAAFDWSHGQPVCRGHARPHRQGVEGSCPKRLKSMCSFHAGVCICSTDDHWQASFWLNHKGRRERHVLHGSWLQFETLIDLRRLFPFAPHGLLEKAAREAWCLEAALDTVVDAVACMDISP